jgi:hypothetical protein
VGRLLLLFFGLSCTLTSPAQTTASAAQVKRVFVGPFGRGVEAEQIRRSLIQILRKDKKIELADTDAAADATLTGSGEVWIKGYYTLNARARTIGGNTQPIYGGYISVELRDRQKEVLWSYLATPQRMGLAAMSRNLAGQIARKLTEAVSH